mgnify:CR=1 FL=1
MNMKDKCPKCGGDDLEDAEWFVEQCIDGDQLILNVVCVGCGYKYREIFTHVATHDLSGEEIREADEI